MAQGFSGSTISSLVDNKACDGRLTLATATPVTTTDQTAKTTVYFTPYKGNRIALYDGSAWQMITFSEVSVAVPATTSTPFDIWGVLSGGALTLETTSWTNDTTRATALVLQDGVQSKTGSVTRRYLGTGRTTGVSGQTEDSVTNRLLWNFYNRTSRRMYIFEATSHTYATGSFRKWNNATAAQVHFVIGLVEDSIIAVAYSRTAGDAVSNTTGITNVGLNSGTARMSGNEGDVTFVGVTATPQIRANTFESAFPALGYNFLTTIEFGMAGATFHAAETIGLIIG